MPAITITDLNNAKLDVDHIAAIATSTAATATDRLGGVKNTLHQLIANVQAYIDGEVAILSGTVWATEALGRASVADGFSFKVQGDVAHVAAYEYRRVNSTTSEIIATYPSKQFFDDTFPGTPLPGYVLSIQDTLGNAAFGVKDDGATHAAKFVDFKMDGHEISSAVDPLYAYRIEDSLGNVVFGVRKDGTVDTNSTNPVVAATVSSGRFVHNVNYINNMGQSLAEGSTPAVAITTAQEYDNIGFPAKSTSPSAFVDLTVANTQVSSRGESSMYGTAAHIKELILKDNGLSYTDHDYQLLCCNNGYGGYSITQLNKGTAPYTAMMSQVQAGYNIATAAGRTFTYAAMTWTQGEADVAMSAAAYADLLIAMAQDIDDDAKAITGQKNDVITITYQCGRSPRSTAHGLLEAADRATKIYIACPIYQFDFGDYTHITAASEKWMGGYYGLVYKRVVIDGLDWQPLRPVSHSVNGTVLDLFFNKTGLVLDTTLMPAQTNYGFRVNDSGGTAQTISSVAVMAQNRVRITLAGSVPAGGFVTYGQDAGVGKEPCVDGMGNLRDNQGDMHKYDGNPLHNWCVLFSYPL